MKAFKIYTEKTEVNLQVKWVGALILVIAIVIGVVGAYNYFKFPAESPEEFSFSVRALIIKELYVAAGLGIIGIILLIGGSFAASNKEEEPKANGNDK